jgi:hypothetical protein
VNSKGRKRKGLSEIACRQRSSPLTEQQEFCALQKQLARFPGLFSAITEAASPVRVEESVEILRILHGAQNWP